MKKQLLRTLVLLLIGVNGLFSQNAISVTKWISGISIPLGMAHCGDDRLFVIEKAGKIRIIQNNKLIDTPFLDIINKVRSSGGEQGLLGICFHPDYQTNGYFYVNYTNRANPTQTVIERYQVSANPAKADSSSGSILLSITQPYTNHNGGCIKFGLDGYLYIGMGDGGSGGDPQNYAQNKKSLLGKMLRLDIDTLNRYKIPLSNPFVKDTSYLKEIWALGVRNPWRFSFDRLTGDLWIGDVGQGDWEEIDFALFSDLPGKNFGWRCYEGNKDFNLTGCNAKSNYTFPLHEYFSDENVNGCSITGGYVYRGEKYPSLYGKYIYADYCSGKIWILNKSANNSYTNTLAYDFTNNALTSFGEDVDGNLYFTDVTSGSIYKISDTCKFKIKVLTEDPICSGGFSGLAKTDLVDPTRAKFLWSTGDTIPELKNLNAGIYSVSVMLNNCIANDTFSLTDPVGDTTRIFMASCDLSQVGIDTIIFTGGLCDSVVMITTTLIPQQTACITVPFITSFCEGDSAVLIACDPLNANGLEWYKDSILLIGKNTKRLWVYEPGNYQFTFLDSTGCKAIPSAGVEITVFPLPNLPELQIFKDSLYASPGYPSYRWFLDGKLLGGSTANYWKAAKEGLYQVEVIDSNQCYSKLSDTVRYLITKLYNFKKSDSNFEVVPNPVHDIIKIRFQKTYQQELLWSIVDVQSKIIRTGRSRFDNSNNSINVLNIETGFYFIFIQTPDGIEQNYFIKL
ncbi:MAG: PQQ-dependent sugar dehydrogenase [Saprospiraceae bacterium]|nr:PQQ-dependent sugar dehydrogenase [Saprospiraceae bacterium]